MTNIAHLFGFDENVDRGTLLDPLHFGFEHLLKMPLPAAMLPDADRLDPARIDMMGASAVTGFYPGFGPEAGEVDLPSFLALSSDLRFDGGQGMYATLYHDRPIRETYPDLAWSWCCAFGGALWTRGGAMVWYMHDHERQIDVRCALPLGDPDSARATLTALVAAIREDLRAGRPAVHVVVPSDTTSLATEPPSSAPASTDVQSSASGSIAPTSFVDRDGPIDQLELSNRTWNALMRAGFHTVGALLDATPRQFEAIRGFGTRSRDELHERLATVSTEAPPARFDRPAAFVKLVDALYPWRADIELPLTSQLASPLINHVREWVERAPESSLLEAIEARGIPGLGTASEHSLDLDVLGLDGRIVRFAPDESSRDLVALEHRFGLDGAPMTSREVAIAFGVSESRVSQMLARVRQDWMRRVDPALWLVPRATMCVEGAGLTATIDDLAATCADCWNVSLDVSRRRIDFIVDHDPTWTRAGERGAIWVSPCRDDVDADQVAARLAHLADALDGALDDDDADTAWTQLVGEIADGADADPLEHVDVVAGPRVQAVRGNLVTPGRAAATFRLGRCIPKYLNARGSAASAYAICDAVELGAWSGFERIELDQLHPREVDRVLQLMFSTVDRDASGRFSPAGGFVETDVLTWRVRRALEQVAHRPVRTRDLVGLVGSASPELQATALSISISDGRVPSVRRAGHGFITLVEDEALGGWSEAQVSAAGKVQTFLARHGGTLTGGEIADAISHRSWKGFDTIPDDMQLTGSDIDALLTQLQLDRIVAVGARWHVPATDPTTMTIGRLMRWAIEQAQMPQTPAQMHDRLVEVRPDITRTVLYSISSNRQAPGVVAIGDGRYDLAR